MSVPPCVYIQPTSTRQHVRRHLHVFTFNPPLHVNMYVVTCMCLLSTHLYTSTCTSSPPCVYFQPTSTRQHVRRHLHVFTFNPPLHVNMYVVTSMCLHSTHLYPSTCTSSLPCVYFQPTSTRQTCTSSPACVYFQPTSTRQHVRRHLHVFNFNPPLPVNMYAVTSLRFLLIQLYTSTYISVPPCVYFQHIYTCQHICRYLPVFTFNPSLPVNIYVGTSLCLLSTHFYRQHSRRYLPVFTFNPPLHVDIYVGTSLCLLSTHLYLSTYTSVPPCVYFQPTYTRRHICRYLPVFTFNPSLPVNIYVGTSLCLLSTHFYLSTYTSVPPCVYFQPISTCQHIRRYLPVFTFNPPLPVNIYVGTSLCLLSPHLYPSTCTSVPPCVYVQSTSTCRHIRRYLPVFTFNPPLPVNIYVGTSLCLLSTHLYPSTYTSVPACVYFQPTSTRRHIRRYLPVFTFNPPLPVDIYVGTSLCLLSTHLYPSTYTSVPPCVYFQPTSTRRHIRRYLPVFTFHEPPSLSVCRLHTKAVTSFVRGGETATTR